MRWALLFLSTTALFGADSDFLGRWNLKIAKHERNRAWWLEVTSPSAGRFVGFPGGDTNTIGDLKIARGELTFSYRDGARLIRYNARVSGGELHGQAVDGATTYVFTGRRAPKIDERDDATWKRGQPVELFNGRDLSGWSAVVADKPVGWTVKNGILANAPPDNNLVSSAKFWNFELHAEYRLRPDSNSGIGLRARYEVQIQDDYGKPAELHSHGSLYSRIQPTSNPSRKPGEWQTMDVRLVGRIVTVTLNGVRIIDRKEIEGLTAMATDPDEASPGPISIQGDHKEVEFRKLTVTPLTKP